VNHCKVLFFATLKDLAGERMIILEVPDRLIVGELRTLLAERFPALAPSLTHAFIAVNREYATDDENIPPGAEIAVFPPVSGG
jgi:molybdopterin converting factor subunit 1